MIIPISVSLIITTLMMGFGLVASHFPVKAVDLAMFSPLPARETGQVLGVAETGPDDNKVVADKGKVEIIAGQKSGSNLVVEVVEKVKEEIKKVQPRLSEVWWESGFLEKKETVEIGPVRINQEGIAPEIIARGVAVMDSESEKLLFSKNLGEAMPIASLTKLMTALVFLEINPGWETVYEIQREDRREGGKIYLYWGERARVEDLFYLSLVGSANTATLALVHSTGLSEEEFVARMNDKAQTLGLAQTVFSDPIGLSNANVSTARETAILVKAALAHKDIRQATLTKNYEFKTLAGQEKKAVTTDYLLENFPQNGLKIIGGKTGFIPAAGYCFAGEFIDAAGNEVVSVILGSSGYQDRFDQTRTLVEWVYDNYYWPVE